MKEELDLDVQIISARDISPGRVDVCQHLVKAAQGPAFMGRLVRIGNGGPIADLLGDRITLGPLAGQRDGAGGNARYLAHGLYHDLKWLTESVTK